MSDARMLGIALLILATAALGCGPGGHDHDHADHDHADHDAGAAEDHGEHGAGSGASPSGAWELTAIVEDGSETPPVEGTAVTLIVTNEGQAMGDTGCNRYTGAVEDASEGSLALGPMATTRKACPEPVMDQEQRYLAALHAVTGYHQEGDELHLSFGDGGVLAYARTTMPGGEGEPSTE